MDSGHYGGGPDSGRSSTGQPYTNGAKELEIGSRVVMIQMRLLNIKLDIMSSKVKANFVLCVLRAFSRIYVVFMTDLETTTLDLQLLILPRLVKVEDHFL